ncbi:hypothetical protein H6503_00825 [Candidatus Woesearchaeota archaeon]|nr:hypothetical protein [Candidatus Woesearchaeota archaeon]
MVDDKPTGETTNAYRTYLVDKHRMNYEGLFVVQDLYKLIDEYYEEKGYDKREFKNAEIVRDDGVRFIEIIFEPWKKITDYAKSVVKLRMLMENVKDVEIEKDGVKVNAHHGQLSFVFDVYVDTDYEERWGGKWGNKAIYAFIRLLFDKYFFKRYTQQYFAEALDDYKLLQYQIKSYLNMNKQ